ncbi:hypothetical protein [Nannocystis sp. SCPEA4]|uniref:hypothetical protein n=1 Tax=Nannocystis sp. SCPEA4 TaxID=2996787 RepID=UPI00226F12C5|nr:hypothetical protein [Nannocystis sp. SCPEA4]MCY1054908.1 hypothetical protein [Nannocystis sp. SCPEA4]
MRARESDWSVAHDWGRAWGLIARGDYVDEFAQTVEGDIVPRLSRLGLELR